MDSYNRYVTAVNKIFDYLEKMKVGWNNLDNKNYIESIEEFKNIVISKADLMKQPPTVKMDMNERRSEVTQKQEETPISPPNKAMAQETDIYERAAWQQQGHNSEPVQPVQETVIGIPDSNIAVSSNSDSLEALGE